MTQTGRGSMGSHKHGTSGRSGHNADLQQLARDLNREADERARARRKRKATKTYSSIDELMRNRRER